MTLCGSSGEFPNCHFCPRALSLWYISLRYNDICAVTLSWFQSYLTGRSISVQQEDFFLSAAPLTCGVPQGSILAPILFLLSMLPFEQLWTTHYIAFHCYTDDLQLYLLIRPIGQAALHPLLHCLADEEVDTYITF